MPLLIQYCTTVHCFLHRQHIVCYKQTLEFPTTAVKLTIVANQNQHVTHSLYPFVFVVEQDNICFWTYVVVIILMYILMFFRKNRSLSFASCMRTETRYHLLTIHGRLLVYSNQNLFFAITFCATPKSTLLPTQFTVKLSNRLSNSA